MIALRLEQVLPNWVHMDQTGFIRNNSSFDNIRRLMNVMFSAKQVDHLVIALPLDAENFRPSRMALLVGSSAKK